MPHEFHDCMGREWHVKVNAVTIGDVRAYYPWFLTGPAVSTFERLAPCATDMRAANELIDVLFILCRDQADERHVSDEQFGGLMFGDKERSPIDDATGALIDAVFAFIRPDEAKLLKEARARNIAVREAAKQRVLARFIGDPKTHTRIAQEL